MSEQPVPPVSPAGAINPPPEEIALATFIVREVVALLFVAGWLLLLAGELVSGSYTVPLWLNCVGVAVLGFALGLDAAELVYRPPRGGRRYGGWWGGGRGRSDES